MLRRFELGRIYRPTAEWDADGSELGQPWEDLHLTTRDDVRLSAWFFPATQPSPRGHLAALLCHGNGGNISHRLDTCRLLLSCGLNVLVFDYRGYGRSAGAPGEEGTYLDAQAAHGWLRQRGFAGPEIIPYGESLGGGIASELALRESIGGLILQSTFTSIPDVGARLYPWLPVRWLSSIHYNTRAKLPRVKVPVLVMHSRQDSLIPFQHGEQNFAAANAPKLFWETNGDHNYSLHSDQERCREGLERFFNVLERARGQDQSKFHGQPPPAPS